MQYVVSFLVLKNISPGKRDCVTCIVFLMSYDSYCSFPFPPGAVDWSAVCDCGISWSYTLELPHEISNNVADVRSAKAQTSLRIRAD